jgi:hypothetical protein
MKLAREECMKVIPTELLVPREYSASSFPLKFVDKRVKEYGTERSLVPQNKANQAP